LKPTYSGAAHFTGNDRVEGKCLIFAFRNRKNEAAATEKNTEKLTTNLSKNYSWTLLKFNFFLARFVETVI
jgi:aminopeptidase C